MRPDSPSWLKKKLIFDKAFFAMKNIIAETGVNTVCEEALCPNITECFSRRYATFLILGKDCTRNCAFCSVKKRAPKPLDLREPAKIASMVERIRPRYIVITSVTRDDLPDGGAGQFVRVIRKVRALGLGVKIEILVPDFNGDKYSLGQVVKARPEVLGHNIETVKRLYPEVRNKAEYARSLSLLKAVKIMNPSQLLKSGIMVGLGEDDDEIRCAIKDLKEAGCDIITIGQYLRPGKGNLPVARFAEPEAFKRYAVMAKEAGFKSVISGPFVRSSYLAERSSLL